MLKQNSNINVIWKPIPNSTQSLAIDTRCDETLLCGSRGSGKTEAQLMAFLKYVGVGYGHYWSGIIFDQKNKSLKDIIKRSIKLFGKIKGAVFNKVEKQWNFATGESLQFAILRLPEDYWNFHGHEYSFIGFNELTKYPTSYLYDAIYSCNRTGFKPDEHVLVRDGKVVRLPPIPLMFFSTTNPNGAGRNWVKRRFIDVAKYGEVYKKEIKYYDFIKNEEVITVRTQVAIFSSCLENPYLSKTYLASLFSDPDENRRKAWALGSWEVVSGGALGDLWDRSKHVIPRFKVPENWYVDRSLDWGSSHPYSVGWWAQCDGTEVIYYDKNGNEVRFCPPAGSLIQIAELYGSEEIGTNRGLRKAARVLGEEIRDYERVLSMTGYIGGLVNEGPADNQIWNNVVSDYSSIAELMGESGIYWSKSDKSAGSRQSGLEYIRNMLYNTIQGNNYPHIYFMENCRASIETLPYIERDEKKLDDVDTTSEDHAYDMVRYRVLDNVKNQNYVLGLNYA